jgi:hypothetical protein
MASLMMLLMGPLIAKADQMENLKEQLIQMASLTELPKVVETMTEPWMATTRRC